MFSDQFEYEMIVHRMYKTEETTATCCANHFRLYLYSRFLPNYIKIINLTKFYKV